MVKLIFSALQKVLLVISFLWPWKVIIGWNLLWNKIWHANFLTKHTLENSDQRIVIFPVNRNRNRFAEPTSVRIGIGIVCESQNLRIGIGIIFVRWEVFANYSWIPEVIFLLYIFLIISFSLLLYIFPFSLLTGQRKPKWNICPFSIYFPNKNKIFMNTLKIFANRNIMS